VEQVNWEAVTKTEYQPVTWPTDDAYWCGDAGLRSERKPDYHGSYEKCVVAADPDPPAVIQQLTLLPINATADPTGRQLKLTIGRTGILRLTYDPACLNPPSATPPDAWDELTIDP
jgi:hypothetical protein